MGLLRTLGLAKPPTTTTAVTQLRAVGSGSAPARQAGGPPARGRGRKRRKGRPSGPAASLQDRRRRLIGARDLTLRDLGGLMLEMYKRNRFREELLLDKCEEVLAIEVEVAHIDQRLFQLASPTQSGQRPIGRCECGSPLMPGQNFCASCGRALGTLTQSRPCARCGSALRPGDSFCSTCGNEAPDALEVLAAPTAPAANVRASTATTTARQDTPPLDDAPAPAAAATSAAATDTPTTVIDLPTSGPGAAEARPALSVVPTATEPDTAIQAALSVLPPLPTSTAPTFPTGPISGAAAPAQQTAGNPKDQLSPKEIAKIRARQQRERQKAAKERAKERMREAKARAKGGR